MYQCLKSSAQIGGSRCYEELVKELPALLSHQPKNMEEALLWRGGFFTKCTVGDLNQVRVKLNQTGYQRILQQGAIRSRMRFLGQGFLLMQDNDRKSELKNPQMRLTTGISCRKAGKNYLRFTSSL